MIPNRIVRGSKAEILAYGFSGNNPYHFSSKYLIPCATKIEQGRIKKIIASELNPVMIKQNTNNNEAIEFLEAKNPFVVENNPISASAKTGRLNNGDRKTLSILWCQENTKESALAILLKKWFGSKPLLRSNSGIISGRWKIPIPSTANPPSKTTKVRIKGNFGKSFTMNRKCGWHRTNNTQNAAK